MEFKDLMSASRAHSLSGQTLNDMVVKISRAHNPIIKAPKVRRTLAREVVGADSGGP